MTRRVRALITAGPTREALDPVRFISNASTGAQGVALAEEALSRGWDVDLVHGPLETAPPRGARRHAVTTAREMLDACRKLASSCDVVIAAAAVSDYRPREPWTRKRKRDGSTWTLQLEATEDILLALGMEKGNRVHAGFALETEDLERNARRKLEEKNLDWIVANGPDAIGAAGGDYVLLGADGTRYDLRESTKRGLARELLDRVAATLEARGR